MERITRLKELLTATPQDSFLEHALALEYVKEGNDARAGTIFRQLLDRDPAYIGSYYHLAKLLERQERVEEAVRVYEKGMEEAKKAGDNHAHGELRAAYEELTF